LNQQISLLAADDIDPSHTVILVVDMQNAFFSASSTLGDRVAKQALIPRLELFVDRARAKKVNLAFIHMVTTDNDASPRMRERRIKRGLKDSTAAGTEGIEFLPELQPCSGDIIVEKNKFNAFLNTPLDARLRNRGISTIVVTGVFTNVCVGMTACDGSMRNYFVIVPSDMCVGTTEQQHESFLSNINSFFGKVTSSHELLQIWDSC
jgi:ureidoacrylate peracid hydrolase